MGFLESDNLAIDIGSHSVKGVVVGPKKDLKRFASVPIPAGAIEGGVVRNSEQVVTCIQQLWKNLGGKDQKVISVVPGQHVFVRQLFLPSMKKQELDQAVRFQAEGQIPIPPAEVVLDYSVISQNKGSKQVEVLVVASRKSVVQQIVHLLNQAKITPKVLDLESLALSRIFLDPKKGRTGELDLIASIGAVNTHISLFDGEVPRFTRSIPFGGLRFTRALAAERQMSMEQAEERKIVGELPEEAFNLMNDLAGELKRSIDFFHSQNKDQVVKQVVLSGGSAQLPKLSDFLFSKLGIPVSIGDPTDNVKIPKRFMQPGNLEAFRTSYAPAIGLAVRGLK